MSDLDAVSASCSLEHLILDAVVMREALEIDTTRQGELGSKDGSRSALYRPSRQLYPPHFTSLLRIHNAMWEFAGPLPFDC